MTSIAYKDEITKETLSNHNATLFEVGSAMILAKLPIDFVSVAITSALKYEGISDLVILWANENEEKERNEIVADIQDLIDDCKKTSIENRSYIKFNDLDNIKDNIRDFKDKLLIEVNKKGGISELSKITKIPQPSLSRLFNSNSMPRRQTLLTIASALKLDGISLNEPWVS